MSSIQLRLIYRLSATSFASSFGAELTAPPYQTLRQAFSVASFFRVEHSVTSPSLVSKSTPAFQTKPTELRTGRTEDGVPNCQYSLMTNAFVTQVSYLRKPVQHLNRQRPQLTDSESVQHLNRQRHQLTGSESVQRSQQTATSAHRQQIGPAQSTTATEVCQLNNSDRDTLIAHERIPWTSEGEAAHHQLTTEGGPHLSTRYWLR